MLINNPIRIIDLIPAPAQIIIRGPKDTLGNELSTVRQGSNNFEKTLISVLVNLELVLASILKGNGDDKK